MARTGVLGSDDPCASPPGAVDAAQPLMRRGVWGPPGAGAAGARVSESLASAGASAAPEESPTGRPGTASADARDIALFRQSLAEAERTFDFALAGDRTARLLAPMLHTTACHNLAGALASVGEADEAHDLRLCMLSELVQHASSPSCPLPLRINCVRHMRPAIGLLLSTIGEDPGPDAAALIAQARRVAHEVISVAAHALGHNMGRASPGTAQPAALQ